MDKKELNKKDARKVSGGNGVEQEEYKNDDSRPWGNHPLMKYGGPSFFKKKFIDEQREKGTKIVENLKKMKEDLMNGKFKGKKDE